jgi:hypothetical protein
MRKIAAQQHISLRTLERAVFVKRYGIPELMTMLERGEVKLGAAEILVRFDQNLQRGVCANGPDAVRRFASINRQDVLDDLRSRREQA